MKKILIIILFLTFIISCGSDKEERPPSPKFHTKKDVGVWKNISDEHIPKIEKIGERKIRVIVEINQSLNPVHYIEAIVLMKGKNRQIAIKKFKPSLKKPEAVFTLPTWDNDYWVISKCNLHDMWRAEVK